MKTTGICVGAGLKLNPAGLYPSMKFDIYDLRSCCTAKLWFPIQVLKYPKLCTLCEYNKIHQIQLINLVETPRPKMVVSDEVDIQNANCWWFA